jgi:hypothetical protein
VTFYGDHLSDFAPYDFPLFLRLKIPPFLQTEVIEGESQAVLNTLIERDFQGAFSK